MAVYDHIWTPEDPLTGPTDPGERWRDGEQLPAGEISTHVVVYTLYLSGLKQRHRHFIRQPDGAITEVRQYLMEHFHVGARSIFQLYRWKLLALYSNTG